MHPKLVSIIIPAYKKEKTIYSNLKRISKVLDKLRYPSEVICVVDGKIDKTYENAQRFAKTNKKIKVVGYEVNKGKGYAVRFGMAVSKGDIIGFIDSGDDIDPNGLSMLLEHFEWYDADIIVGSKRHPASKVEYSWQRKILSIGYQLLTRLLFGLKIRDTQVGIKFYRRQVLEKVLPRLLVKRFAFDIEILAVANYLGFTKMYEAPVKLKLDFGDNSVLTSHQFLKTVGLMLLDTLAIFYRLKILHYYSDKNNNKWRWDPDLNFKVNLP